MKEIFGFEIFSRSKSFGFHLEMAVWLLEFPTIRKAKTEGVNAFSLV